MFQFIELSFGISLKIHVITSPFDSTFNADIISPSASLLVIFFSGLKLPSAYHFTTHFFEK